MTGKFLKKIVIATFMLIGSASASIAMELPKYKVLDYVPADTMFFYGRFSSQAFDQHEYFVAKGLYAGFEDDAFKDAIKEGDTSSDKFVLSLMLSFIKHVSELEAPNPANSMVDQAQNIFYMADYIPVYKFKTDDVAAIWDMLAKAEQDSGLKATTHSYKGVEYSSYALKTDDETDVELIVSSQDDWVTMTMGLPDGNNQHFDSALAVKKPIKSLNQTDVLQNMIDKYGFDGQQLIYLDHERIVNIVTGYASNAVWENLFRDNKKRKQLSEACQKDIAGLVANWPRTVMGTSLIETNDAGIHTITKLIVENYDVATNEALMAMRGHIPPQNSAMASFMTMALGLNLDNLTDSVTKLWRGAVEAKFECEELVEMQAELKELNPVLLNMFTGMARGVYGMSLAIYEMDVVDVENAPTKVENVDAVLTLSANDPRAQFLSMALLEKGLATINLLDDGTEVDISHLMQPDSVIQDNVKVAINGKHLNLYRGEKARQAAVAMTQNSIENNGVLGFSVNYARFFDIVEQQLERDQEVIPEAFQKFFDLDINVVTVMDFTENGIEFETDSLIGK